MKRIAIALIALFAAPMFAAQPKPKPAPKPQQCAVSMPTPDGKMQTVTVDCSVYVLINYLQQQITQLQGSKLDKVDPQTSTRVFSPKEHAGTI